MAKGGSTQTTVQSNDPWIGAQPALNKLMTSATSAYDATGKTTDAIYAAPSQDYTRAVQAAATAGPNTGLMSGLADVLNNTKRYAYGAEPLRTLADDTISGKYLDPNSNPYLKGAIDAAIHPVQDSLNQNLLTIGDAAQKSGAYGGDREGITRALALKNFDTQALDATSNLTYQNYAAERQNQMNAGQLYQQATGLDTARDTAANSIYQQQAAEQLRAQQQQLQMLTLQQQISQQGLDAANAAPWAGMQNLAAALGVASPYGTQTGTTTGSGQSAGAGALSGALGGASAGSAFGPWGAGIGAVVGGLGSFL